MKTLILLLFAIPGLGSAAYYAAEFVPVTESQVTEPVRLNLADRMREKDVVYDSLARGECGLAEAVRRVRMLDARPPVVRPWEYDHIPGGLLAAVIESACHRPCVPPGERHALELRLRSELPLKD